MKVMLPFTVALICQEGFPTPLICFDIFFGPAAAAGMVL